MRKNQLLTPVSRAKAAWLWAGRQATLGGLSAAAMHGSKWIDAKEPADLFRLGDAVEGINIHRDKLAVGETCVVDGMPPQHPPGRRSISGVETASSVPSSGWTP